MKLLGWIGMLGLVGCSGPEPKPDRISQVHSDTASSDTAAADTASPDTGSPDSGSPDTGSPDSGSPDTGTPIVSCPDELEGTASVCIEIDSTGRHEVPRSFSGFNSQNFRDGWQAWDPRLENFARSMVPGTIRFPGGASSSVYHWRTGSAPQTFVDAYLPKSSKTQQLNDYRENIGGKGFMKLRDTARLAAVSGARLIISVNPKVDSPESIGAWVEKTIARGYPVEAWQLSSEAHKWADDNWCDDDPCTAFWEGGDGYVDDMLPYYEAIASAYEDAGLPVPDINMSSSDDGSNSRMRRFDGVVRDGHSYTADTGQGIAYYGSEHDSDLSHNKYWNSWVHHWYPGHTSYLDPTLGTVSKDETDTFWPIFKADVDYLLTQRTGGHIDDYYLPIRGVPGFGDEVPDDFRATISEYNIRYSVPYTETTYAGLHAAESVLRWVEHDRVARVGYHMLTASCMGVQDTNRYPPIWANNANISIDPQDLDFGVYDELPALALRLVNQAVNTAEHRLDTQVHGGLQVEAGEAIQDEDIYSDWVWHTAEETELVPTVFASAFSGRDARTRIVITNRSAEIQSLSLVLDGVALTSEEIISAEVLSTDDELFENDGDVEGWEIEHPDEGDTADADTGGSDVDVDDVRVESLPTDGLSLRPWSVTLITLHRRFSDEAPAAPGGLMLSSGPGSILASWSPVAGASSYRVVWGVDSGVYTFSEEVESTSFTLSDQLGGITTYLAVSAIDGDLEGPIGPELSAEASRIYQSSESFEDGPDLSTLSIGCGSDGGWAVEDGGLGRSVTTGAGSCVRLGAEDTLYGDQWISTRIQIDAWTDTSLDPRVGLVGRCVDDDHCVIAYIDLAADVIRIVLKHPDIAGGWDVIGRSDSLTDLPVFSAFLDDLGAVGSMDTQLGLDLDGQTIRVWLGEGTDRRLVAAAIDNFSCDESTGECVHDEEAVGVPLSSAGPAGVFTRRQPVRFDEFRVE